MLVVVPLLTSGVLQKLLGLIGIRVPKNLGMGGSSSSSRGVGETGMADNIHGLMNIAKMFM